MPHRLELVLRRGNLDLGFLDEIDETSLGFNYYLDGHRNTFQVDVSPLENRDTADRDRQRLRAPYQLMF